MKKSDDKTSVVMSTRGGVTLPKALLTRLQWQPGTILVVEDTPYGILLKRDTPETNAVIARSPKGDEAIQGPLRKSVSRA